MSSLTSITFQDELPNKLAATKVYQYRADKAAWRHLSDRKTAGRINHPSSLMVVTWNLDFQTEFVKERIFVALRHLETYVFKCERGEEPMPCCLMFQEVHPDALTHLLEDEWVRNNFVVAPISETKWPIPTYGNVTLVSRSVVVARAGLMSFGYSDMGRGAVVVDVKLNTPTAGQPREITLRLINTHLESLPQGSAMRPVQLSVLASLLKRKTEVQGGVIVGDMNAIGPSDNDIAAAAGLKDSWRMPNRDQSGFTWGYQGGGDFPPARLDKVLFLQRKAYSVDQPRRIGIGLKASDEEGRPIAWASDHYGLAATLRVLG